MLLLMSENLQGATTFGESDIDAEVNEILAEETEQGGVLEEKKRKLVEDEQKLQEREQQDWDKLVVKTSEEKERAKTEYNKRLDEINKFYKAPPTAGEYRKSEQEIIKSVMDKRIAREPLTVWQGIAIFFKTLFKPYKYEQELTRKYQEQNYKKNHHEPIQVPEAIVMNRLAASKKKKVTEQIKKLDKEFDKFSKKASANVEQMKDNILINRENREEANDNKIMQYNEEYRQKQLKTKEKLHNHIDKKLDVALKPLGGLLNLTSIQKPERIEAEFCCNL